MRWQTSPPPNQKPATGVISTTIPPYTNSPTLYIPTVFKSLMVFRLIDTLNAKGIPWKVTYLETEAKPKKL